MTEEKVKYTTDYQPDDSDDRDSDPAGSIRAPLTDEANPGMTFADFDISKNIVDALENMGYVHPTKVQEQAVPVALKKRDLIVLSKTGSGKTAAFGIPVVQLAAQGDIKRALILAPTRELAVQVEEEINNIARGTKVRTTAVYGRHNMSVEIMEIEKGIDVLVGTPGRVLDHLKQGNINGRDFDMLVLDEADRMLDMGFIDEVNKIIVRLNRNRLNMLFSATMPDQIVTLSLKYLEDPVTIELESDFKTVELVEQFYYSVPKHEKRGRLADIIKSEDVGSCLVFCNTRFEVDRVCQFLGRTGLKSKAIHGAHTQTMRIRSLEEFKEGKFKVLVATDVAARGLHIDGLELVINYDLPVELDSYVHRIGRTGRAGEKGVALSFVSDGDLFQFYSIEEHAGVMITERELPESKYDYSKITYSGRGSGARSGGRTGGRSGGRGQGARGYGAKGQGARGYGGRGQGTRGYGGRGPGTGKRNAGDRKPRHGGRPLAKGEESLFGFTFREIDETASAGGAGTSGKKKYNRSGKPPKAPYSAHSAKPEYNAKPAAGRANNPRNKQNFKKNFKKNFNDKTKHSSPRADVSNPSKKGLVKKIFGFMSRKGDRK